MKQAKINETLDSIRDLMEHSTKIMSLNGSAAIFVGIYACLAAWGAYIITGANSPFSDTLEVNTPAKYSSILWLAAALIIISVITVIILSRQRARKIGKPLTFNALTRKTLWNFFMPLFVGGFLCVVLFVQGNWGLTSSLMLIFYGFSLINVSAFTHSDSKYLGYAILALGLADAVVAGHALIFWVIGFGLFHIIYGVYFFLKNKNA